MCQIVSDGRYMTPSRGLYMVRCQMSHESTPLLAQYQASVQHIREAHLRVPTPSGRPSRGPRYIAITKCTEEEGEQYGITTSSQTKGQRWACKTCYGFTQPVWADGPLPDEEDIRQEWAAWAAAQAAKQTSDYTKTRRRLRLDL